jgi:predicted SprT family Zn-dependent metalloprotease
MLAGVAGRCRRTSSEKLRSSATGGPHGGAWRRALGGSAASPAGGGSGLRGGGGGGGGGRGGRGAAAGSMSSGADGACSPRRGALAAVDSPGGASDAAEELTLELDCETQQVRWPAVTERRRARAGPRTAQSSNSLLSLHFSRPERDGRESLLSLSSPLLSSSSPKPSTSSSPMLSTSSPMLSTSSPILSTSSRAGSWKPSRSSPMLSIGSSMPGADSPTLLPAVSPISGRPSGVAVDLETALCQALSSARLADDSAASSRRVSSRDLDEFFSCSDSVSAARTSASSRGVSGGAEHGQASPAPRDSGSRVGAAVNSGSQHEKAHPADAGAHPGEPPGETEAHDGLLWTCADDSASNKRKSSASARRSSRPISLPASPLAPTRRQEVTLLSESSDESVVVVSAPIAPPPAGTRPSRRAAAAVAATPSKRAAAAVAPWTGRHRRVVDSSSESDDADEMRVHARAYSSGSTSLSAGKPAAVPTAAPAAPPTIRRRRVLDSSDESDGAAGGPMQTRIQVRSLPSVSPCSSLASGESGAAPKAQARRFVKASEKMPKQKQAAPISALLVSPAATLCARYVHSVSSGASSRSRGPSLAGSESDSSSYQPSAGGRSSLDSSVDASSVASSASSGVGSQAPRARAMRPPRGAAKGKENHKERHHNVLAAAATGPGAKDLAGKPRQRIDTGAQARPAPAPGAAAGAGAGAGADREVTAKNRAALSVALLAEYNRTVFGGKLPDDLEITWNDRLRRTAGLTYSSTKAGVRRSRVELSAKVLDRESRLNATLLHELCHVAAWLVQGASKPPHGPEFKAWADVASKRYPMCQVERCHSYAIHAPHRYECQTCGCPYKRHSKSVDTDKHVCGMCHGPLVYQGVFDRLGTPRKPRKESDYAQFVKVNFAAVKKRSRAKDMAAVSKKLARLWREVKQAQRSGDLLLSPGKLSRLSGLSSSPR